MPRSSMASQRWPGRPRIGLVLAAWLGLGGLAASAGTVRPGRIDAGRTTDPADALLREYFARFLADRDFEAFRDRVDARYSEATLCRLLADSPDETTRRASVVALGSLGRFPSSNRALGRALRDPDPVVRRLAEQSLWSLWFRADTDENNRTLMRVRRLMELGALDRAEEMVTRLIADSPRFAEAYNQRAIIRFEQGRFDESARDCRRVLDLNPYHFGALGGLAQCHLRLSQTAEAVEVLRRAAALQPYNRGLRDRIRWLEERMEQGET